MRLLETSTLELQDVPDSELHLEKNQYAILSHRWGSEEVSYQDMISEEIPVSKKHGLEKIQNFCKLALSMNCNYAWADTCCINKGNSSELAEAINSMYLWYSQSKICIAYLADVPQKDLTDSEWFDRGWTLQELIAPKRVSFFDAFWNRIGTKTEMIGQLSDKTRIPRSVLNRNISPVDCSIAQRMSWAAERVTTRPEDRAYSLMGLFGVNMPMIYGEREQAFLRLQQHIIQKSKDESIFAWTMEPNTTYCGLYAPSPSVFANSRDIVPATGSRGYSETNGELSIILKCGLRSPSIWFALLCCTQDAREGSRVAIMIAKVGNGSNHVRVKDPVGLSKIICYDPEYYRPAREAQLRFPVDPVERPESIYYGFWLRTVQPPNYAKRQITVVTNSPTSEPDYVCQVQKDQGYSGVIYIEPDSPTTSSWSDVRWLIFGFDEDFNPFIWLANERHSSRLLGQLKDNQSAKTGSLDSNPLMVEDTYEQGLDYFQCVDVQYGWPEGRAIVKVGNTGLRHLNIPRLGLQISVQLQPYRSPSAAGLSRGGLDPTKVWVVDITNTPKIENPIQIVFSPATIEIDWYRWFWASCAIFLCCGNWCKICECCDACSESCCGGCEDDIGCLDLCSPCRAEKVKKAFFEKESREVQRDSQEEVDEIFQGFMSVANSRIPELMGAAAAAAKSEEDGEGNPHQRVDGRRSTSETAREEIIDYIRIRRATYTIKGYTTTPEISSSGPANRLHSMPQTNRVHADVISQVLAEEKGRRRRYGEPGSQEDVRTAI